MCQPPGGAEEPLALPPQQCGAWIEGVPALIQSYRTKSLKKQTLKVLLDFFLVRAAHHPCVCGARRAFSAMAAVRLPNRGVQGAAPRSPVATGEIPAPRKARNTRPPQRAELPYRTDYSTMPMQPWTARNSSRPVTTGAALEDFPAARRSAAMAYRTVSTVKDTAPVPANLTSSKPPRSPAK